MASTIGGWYLNGSTLQYRLLVTGTDGSQTATGTVLASFTGLSNLTGDKTNVKVKVGDADAVDLSESHIKVENSTEEGSTNYNLAFTLYDDVLGGKTVSLTAAKGTTQTLTIDAAATKNLRKIATGEGESGTSETLSFSKDKKGNNLISVVADLTEGYSLSSSTNRRSGQKIYTYTWYVASTTPETLATISGVRKFDLTNSANDADKAAKIATYKSSATISDKALGETYDGTGVITLSKVNAGTEENPNYTEEGSVLGNTDISIAPTPIATANGISYTLALDASKAGKYKDYAQNLNLEGYKNDAYWSYSGTTASYKIDSPIGYETTNAANQVVKTVGETTKVYASSAIDAAEVADGDTKITKIKFTAAKSTTLVTVTGLAKDLDISEDKKSIGVTKYENKDQKVTSDLGKDLTVTIEDGEYPVYGFNAKGKSIISTPGKVTVNINKNVLNNTTVALSSSVATGKFNVATDNILTATDTPPELNIWVINGSTATYKRVQRAYYKKNAEDTKLTYVAQKDVMTFLTISGLSAEALDSAKKTYAGDAYEPKLITEITGLTSSVTGENLLDLYDKDKKGKRIIKSGSTAATITISPDLLDNRNASITASDNFKIQLSKSSAPNFDDLDDLEWNLGGTKAVLKGDIKAGWIVTQNGKTVTYTKAGENQTLATITGLKKGTKLVVGGSSDARTVGFGNDTSFKQGLSLATNDGLSSNNPVDFSTSTVPGANANYNRQSIIVSKNVIDTLKVQINSNFFDLELAGDGAVGGAVPTDSIPGNYWTLGTTATYKNNFGPYYELANNQLSITYKNPANKTNKPTVLTTIKGLDANVTEGDLTVTGDVVKVNPNALDQKNVTITNPKDGTDYKLALDGDVEPTIKSPNWEQASNGAVTYVANVSGGYKTNSTSSAIVYTPTGEDTTLFTITGLRNGLAKDAVNGSYSGVSLNEDDNTVKLSYSALNNANVALKSSYGYDLVLDSDIPNNLWVASGGTAPTDSIAAWVIDGTTATYKAVIPAYYVYDADKDTLTYKKAADKTVKVGRNKVAAVTYAKISGLSKGLMMNAAGSAIGYYDEDGAFVEGITFDDKDIIIKDRGVLSTTDVKLDNVAIQGGYSIKFAEGLAQSLMPQFNSEKAKTTWTVKNKTAYLIGGVSDGYVLSEDLHSIKYYKGAESTATIATISNLAASVTSEIANSVDGGFSVNGDSITAGANVLGNTKLTLKTNIPIDQHNYKFTLNDDVQTYEEAVENSEKIWTIDTKTSTATYRGFIDSAYYALDGTSTAISYTAAGLPTDLQFAKIEGLTNLVTIVGGALKGVDTIAGKGDAVGKTLFEISSGVLKAGTSVKLTDMNDKDGLTFGLSMAEDVDKPKEAAGFKLSSTAGSITLYNGKTAGYVLDGGLSNLNYTPSDTSDENKLAEISGLTTTFKSNGTTAVAGELYEEIDGIEVNDNDKVITLSNSVLPGNAPVKFEANKGSEYTFALDSDVNQYSSDGLGWKANDNDGFDLYSNIKHAGYQLADDNHAISIMAAGGIDAGTKIGSISGIKGTANATTYQIAGISFSDNRIILSKGVLNGKDVTLSTNGNYTLALNTDEDDSGYVAGSKSTNIWTFNNGTAIYEQKTTEGYEVDTSNNKTIKYSKASTITTKIDNLSKEYVKLDKEGDGNKLIFTGGETTASTGDTGDSSGSTGTEVKAITFNSNTFTINKADVLAHKTSSLTTTVKNAKDPGYKLDLAEGIAATKNPAVWSKTNKETIAKLTQTTKAGYSLQADGKKVIYSSDPTTATLATVSNLKQDVALDSTGLIYNTSIAGLSVTTDATSSKKGVITIAKGVLDTTTAKLGSSDNYEFALATGDQYVAVPIKTDTTKNAWATTSVTKNKVTTTIATYKTVTPAYYAFATVSGAEDKKQIIYNKADDKSTAFTITGLKSGVKANPDGSLESISLNETDVLLSSAVLGTTTVSLSGGNYNLKVGDGALNHNKADSGWKAQSEWIASSGTTYTYKTYDKASYGLDTVSGSATNGAILYYPATAGTTHAVVKGLRSGIEDISTVYEPTDKNNKTLGGVLKLTSAHLNKAKVTLTNSGDTKIVLALDSKDTDLAISEPVPGSWTTNKTKATLSGTVPVGYALSEDKKTITYNKTKMTKTLATVNGIKSGATIADTDYNKDTGVITLGKDQLGTSNVTVSGDGYTLKLADENLKSTSDAPAWIKTEGSTKATYTQTIYNGFMEEDKGKTLKYYKNTTNVNYITINGLKSDLKASDFGSDGEAKVKFDKATHTITIKADALAKSNVTLATTKDYSDYSLELAAADKDALKVKGTDDAKITYWTFSDGTAKLLQGKTEGWTRINAKLITYTKPSVTTLATISGLPKTLTFTEDLATPANNAIEGITLDSDGESIKLDKRALGSLTNDKSSVTLSTSGDYRLALDTTDETNKVAEQGATDEGKPVLTLSGTNAYLKAVTTGGYKVGDYNAKKKTQAITYYADKNSTSNLATITGLPKGCKLIGGKIYLSDGTTELLSYTGQSSSDKQVNVNSNFLITNRNAINLSITGGTFNSVTGLTVYDNTSSKNFATFSKGTMTYKHTAAAGWTLTSSADSVTGYQYKTEATSNIATVSGLNTAVDSFGTGNGIYSDTDKTFAVGSNALTAKNVTITMPKNTKAEDFYQFTFRDDVYSTVNASTEAYWKDQVEWVNNGKGTATYKLYDKGNYSLQAATSGNGKGKNTTIKYIAPTAGTGYATLTGLTNAASIGNTDIDYTKGVVSLTADDLSTKTVVLKTAANPTTSLLSGASLTSVTAAKDFKLDFATGDNGVVESKVESAVWDTTGTTAKLVGTVTKGYILSTDKKSVTYQSKNQDGKTIAQITGLRNGAEIKASDVTVSADDKRISYVGLDSYDLGTKSVTVTGAGYKLALAENVIQHSLSTGEGGWSLQSDWTASNGTFTYKEGYDKANWELIDNDTKVKYYAATTGTSKLAITGLNKDIITADVDSAIAGTESAGAIVSLDSATKIVTLGEKALNRANIAMSKNLDGYTFENVKDEIKSKASDLTGTVSNTTVTVKATQSQGYLLTNNSQGFTYYANATTPNIAIISGLTSEDYAASLKGNGAAANLKFEAESNTFTLKSEQLSKKVGVSGTARFSFDSNYSNAAINGSAGVDNIAVAGSGLSINASNGNDYIDLGTGGNNTFLYANGNGNDVIANFTAGTDKIQLTNINKAGVSIKKDNDDALVTLKVGKTTGTIRVKGLGENLSGISITAKDGEYAYTSSNVLADDNFATTPQLSSIFKGSSGYMVTDDLTADATSLTKTYTTIAYSGDKK